MDADQFDDLLRSLTMTPSRRRLLSALLGLAVTGPLSALLGLGDTAAKKRRKKKKKCKGCTVCQTCNKKKGKCKPKAEGANCGGNKVCQSGACVCPTACCSNDDCGFQGACEAGVCDCKSGAKFCQDTCIPVEDCCTSTECADPRVCDGGQCVCPSGQKDCSGACIPQEYCCEDADCDSGESCLANGSCAIVGCGGICTGGCECHAAPPPTPVCVVSGQGPTVCPLAECSTAADCPFGQACVAEICNGDVVNRCELLC